MSIEAILKSFFQPKEFEQPVGGLRRKLTPSRSFHVISDEEEINLCHDFCIKTLEYENSNWEFEDVRRHHRFLDIQSLLYYPTLFPRPKFNNKTSQYLWQLHTAKTKPDHIFVNKLSRMLAMTMDYLKPSVIEGKIRIDTFMIPDSIFQLYWLDPLLRRRYCTLIATLLSCQTDLKNIFVENTQLRHEDGFRLLLIFALTVGNVVEELNLWHFFVKGVMPLDLGYKEDLNDTFPFTFDLNEEFPQEEKDRIWKQYIISIDPKDLPNEHFYFYTICLSCFTNLTTLKVQYNWMSMGQGVTLCNLGAIKTGTLRDLYLLCSKSDLPTVTGSVISAKAWKHILNLCPNLKVHLIILNIPAYDDNKLFLQDGMPLRSYHLTTGFPIIDYDKYKEWWFDCILRTIIFKYKKTLCKLSLEVWHPRQRIDIILCRCLTECYYLQEFDYSGPLDKFDTIYEIMNYVLDYPTRLKFIRIMIQEDPCSPEKYRAAQQKIEDEYTTKLYNIGITLIIGTYKL